MDIYGVDSTPAPLGEWIRTVDAALVVDPPAGVLDGIVAAALEGDCVAVRLLLSADAAGGLADDFLLETTVAEARSRGRLAVRIASADLDERLLVGDGTARVVVPIEGTVGIFDVSSEDLVSPLREKYERHWEAGERVRTRAPPRTDLFDAAADRLGDRFVDEFDDALSGADHLAWHGTPTPIELSLVVAGRSGEHLYDVSRWGEDAGFASRSSLSRAKNELESEGLLTIESDPQERGRPRQRLLVGDERLAEADPDEVVPLMRTMLDEEP